MTPERLEEIRADLVEMPVLAERTHANELLAELDALRATVAEFHVGMNAARDLSALTGAGKTGHNATPYVTSVMLFDRILELGRELGLWN